MNSCTPGPGVCGASLHSPCSPRSQCLVGAPACAALLVRRPLTHMLAAGTGAARGPRMCICGVRLLAWEFLCSSAVICCRSLSGCSYTPTSVTATSLRLAPVSSHDPRFRKVPFFLTLRIVPGSPYTFLAITRRSPFVRGALVSFVEESCLGTPVGGPGELLLLTVWLPALVGSTRTHSSVFCTLGSCLRPRGSSQPHLLPLREPGSHHPGG